MNVFFPTYYDRAHSYLKQIIDNPPENCDYVTRQKKMEKTYQLYYESSSMRKIINKLFHFSSFAVSPTYLRAVLEKSENVFGADIVYASSNFYLGELPWIIDCEDARSFYRGYEKYFVIHRHQIEKILSKKFCKKIIPWTEKAHHSIFINFDARNFRDKIEVVPLTTKSTPIQLNKTDGDVTFLFVGSSNLDFINDFYYKGGLETIKAFQKISPKYDNTKLIIRSHVDQKIHRIIEKSEKIHLINKTLSGHELKELYMRSSVFVFPCFVTPGMVFVEAMNYCLPIITTDYWANSEYVKDYYNGFLVDMPNTVEPKCLLKCTLSYSRDIGNHRVDENQIEQISERMGYFIENPKEIMRMGKNAKEMIETGKYSMEKKNKKLKRIYEECLKK